MWNLFKANSKDTRKTSFLYPFQLVQKWRVILVSLLLTLNIFPIILLFLFLLWTSKCRLGVSYITSSKLGNKEILSSKMNWIVFFKNIPWKLNSKLLGVPDAAKECWNDCFITQTNKLWMANEGTINNVMETSKVNKYILFCG